jgi:hypothetical protein
MRNDVKFALLAGVAFAALSGASALAGPIPYPNAEPDDLHIHGYVDWGHHCVF